jgi:hypothetical protein
VLLATVHCDVAEGSRRVFTLGNEPVTMHQARDVAEEMVSSLAAEAAVANRRWEATEEQCEHVAHELTLLTIGGGGGLSCVLP